MKARSMLLVGIAGAAGLSGCANPTALTPRGKPVRWILVENRVADLIPEGRWGDGGVDPEARLLSLVPIAREDLLWQVQVEPRDYFVEVLEITPPGDAAPGETVTAQVRVARARKGELYRLTARATRTGVEILGAPQQVVREGAPAFFRFTSRSRGPGGIAIGAEQVEGPGR